MQSNEHIELDDFDREYGLVDLMPQALAAQVLGGLEGQVRFSILLPDGGLYYNGDGTLTRLLNDAAEKIAQKGNARIRSNDGVETAVVFSLAHEMDTLGFLVLQKIDPDVSFDLMVLGRFATACIERVMQLNYRLLLTSGLHGQVVQESYASLKEKASQLKVSEERYRILAQNLEDEVKRKTEEIKVTQLAMLQQEKLASIGQLAAGMAHEINNPIGFIISNLNTLKTCISDLFRLIRQYDRFVQAWKKVYGSKQSYDALQGDIRAIQELRRELDLGFLEEDSKALILESLEGGRRIKSIVQDLRDFAHPSVKAQETVDLNHCLDTTLSMLSGKISSGVANEKNYTDLPGVTCYLRDMNQVFFNIMLNAVQAIGARGQLTLSTRVCGDGYVEIGFADTGPGIQAEALVRVFEPFYTTREVGDGIGLGLYLAHNIVKSHNGTIDVESIEGAGSNFRVRLPVVGS
jgi:hypothetical protein